MRLAIAATLFACHVTSDLEPPPIDSSTKSILIAIVTADDTYLYAINGSTFALPLTFRADASIYLAPYPYPLEELGLMPGPIPLSTAGRDPLPTNFLRGDLIDGRIEQWSEVPEFADVLLPPFEAPSCARFGCWIDGCQPECLDYPIEPPAPPMPPMPPADFELEPPPDRPFVLDCPFFEAQRWGESECTRVGSECGDLPLRAPAGAVFVSQNAMPGGDGSFGDPFDRFELATTPIVVLFPGTYLGISIASGQEVVGACASDTMLEIESLEGPATLRDLTITAGDIDGEVILEDVIIASGAHFRSTATLTRAKAEGQTLVFEMPVHFDDVSLESCGVTTSSRAVIDHTNARDSAFNLEGQGNIRWFSADGGGFDIEGTTHVFAEARLAATAFMIRGDEVGAFDFALFDSGVFVERGHLEMDRAWVVDAPGLGIELAEGTSGNIRMTEIAATADGIRASGALGASQIVVRGGRGLYADGIVSIERARVRGDVTAFEIDGGEAEIFDAELAGAVVARTSTVNIARLILDAFGLRADRSIVGIYDAEIEGNIGAGRGAIGLERVRLGSFCPSESAVSARDADIGGDFFVVRSTDVFGERVRVDGRFSVAATRLVMWDGSFARVDIGSTYTAIEVELERVEIESAGQVALDVSNAELTANDLRLRAISPSDHGIVALTTGLVITRFAIEGPFVTGLNGSDRLVLEDGRIAGARLGLSVPFTLPLEGALDNVDLRANDVPLERR